MPMYCAILRHLLNRFLELMLSLRPTPVKWVWAGTVQAFAYLSRALAPAGKALQCPDYCYVDNTGHGPPAPTTSCSKGLAKAAAIELAAQPLTWKKPGSRANEESSPQLFKLHLPREKGQRARLTREACISCGKQYGSRPVANTPIYGNSLPLDAFKPASS